MERELKETFAQLCNPDILVQSTICQFIDSKVSEDADTQVPEKSEAAIRIVLTFEDQSYLVPLFQFQFI